MDLVFDMETQDPDDLLTLYLMAGHPKVVLRAVTVTPGSKAQIGVVKRALARLGASEIPVGSRTPDHPKTAVSAFHYKLLGPCHTAAPDAEGHELLADVLRQYPTAVVLTGAPLHNLRLLLERHPTVSITRWVGQGGFAGDSVVPAAHRMVKFEGLEVCPTFNFNGDPEGARAMLRSPRVAQRDLVSKNVCHAIAYDAKFHRRLRHLRKGTPGLDLIYEAMDLYLSKAGRNGKKLHDPLAGCIAIQREIAEFREVEVYQTARGWGSRLATGTNTFIIIALDQERFFETFTEH